MKIAYVCADPGIPVFGHKGCSLHVQEMLHALRQQGHHVTLFAARIGGDAPPHLQDLPVISLPEVSGVSGAEREAQLLAMNPAAAAMLAAQGPFDLVYERYALWSDAILAGAKQSQAVTVLEVNAPLIEEQAQYRMLADQRGALESTRRVFAAADVIVTVSDEVTDYVSAFSQAAGRVTTVANGVNTARFFPQRVEQGPFTVGFVGTLKPWHGVDRLLEAFAGLLAQDDNCRLLIVGDGPQRDDLQAQIQQLGLAAAVEFAGAVAPAEVPAQLARMHVGVAPYPQLEHFYFSPLKVYEYMAAGLPVIASRIGQLESLLQHGEHGLLLEPGHTADLTAALQWVRSHPDEAWHMGRNGRRLVEEQHTWDAVCKRILALAAPEQQNDLRGAV